MEYMFDSASAFNENIGACAFSGDDVQLRLCL